MPKKAKAKKPRKITRKQRAALCDAYADGVAKRMALTAYREIRAKVKAKKELSVAELLLSMIMHPQGMYHVVYGMAVLIPLPKFSFDIHLLNKDPSWK